MQEQMLQNRGWTFFADWSNHKHLISLACNYSNKFAKKSVHLSGENESGREEDVPERPAVVALQRDREVWSVDVAQLVRVTRKLWSLKNGFLTKNHWKKITKRVNKMTWKL